VERLAGREVKWHVIDQPGTQLKDSWFVRLWAQVILFVPFRASRTDMEPEEAAASAGTSTSSAAGTGEVGSSPSD
jgi:hypothetical protein